MRQYQKNALILVVVLVLNIKATESNTVYSDEESSGSWSGELMEAAESAQTANVSQSPATESPQKTEVTQSPATESPQKDKASQSPATESPQKTEVSQSLAKESPQKTEVSQSPAAESPQKTEVSQSPTTESPQKTEVSDSPTTESPQKTEVSDSPTTEPTHKTKMSQSPATESPQKTEVSQSPTAEPTQKTKVSQSSAAMSTPKASEARSSTAEPTQKAGGPQSPEGTDDIVSFNENSPYNLTQLNGTWNEAQSYCKDRQMDLVIIENVDEMETLKKLLTRQYDSLDTDVFVGAKYNEKKSAIFWENGRSLSLDDPNWHPDEPNCLPIPTKNCTINVTENCVRLTANFTLRTTDCSKPYQNVHVICERRKEKKDDESQNPLLLLLLLFLVPAGIIPVIVYAKCRQSRKKRNISKHNTIVVYRP